MMMSDFRLLISDFRLLTPAHALGLALAAAVLLALLPARWTDPLRSGAMTALRPAQQGAAALRQFSAQTSGRVRSHFQSADRLAEVEVELDRLREENYRLAAELTATQGRPRVKGDSPIFVDTRTATVPRPASADDDDPAGRLLLAQCIHARVLGRQARAFLARRQLIDVGAASGVEPGDLVVDLPALIDRGSDADLRPGQLVLSGRRVWGKIVHLGPNTSSVRGVTEPGYRDLVFLADPDHAEPASASRPIQGLLEGTGEPLARVRMVDVTAPVSVGDLVYTAAGKGLLPSPLLCGRIVRLEQPAGAAHWEIWMEPAVSAEPDRVAVLRTELNPLRVAGKGTGDRGQGLGIRD
jgi:cell shape-determining protein MreC